MMLVKRARPAASAMFRLCSRAALLALLLLLFAVGAEAGVGDRGAGAVRAFERRPPVEKVQYFFFDDEDYCWYDDGWNGPGWYWCGYAGSQGAGWGGPYGWNGWGGGYHIRRHPPHGMGVWRAGPPRARLGAGGAQQTPGLARPVEGGVHGPGVGQGAHRPGEGGGFHGYGAPASPGFQAGGAPAFHGVGGGGGFQSFGGGSFHGFRGGGTFSGGHGGGHR
jgi:hypothetical protein